MRLMLNTLWRGEHASAQQPQTLLQPLRSHRSRKYRRQRVLHRANGSQTQASPLSGRFQHQSSYMEWWADKRPLKRYSAIIRTEPEHDPDPTYVCIITCLSFICGIKRPVPQGWRTDKQTGKHKSDSLHERTLVWQQYVGCICNLQPMILKDPVTHMHTHTERKGERGGEERTRTVKVITVCERSVTQIC